MNPTLSYFKIFKIFLKTGCIAFGGPASHLVLFHFIFVQKEKYLSAEEYSQLVALCQVIPGPTSSQVGMAIGYHFKGYLGAFYAWLGFSLPSVMLMICIALLGQQYSVLIGSQGFHIIQLIVLAVIGWAFWQMLRSLCNRLWQYILVGLSMLFLSFAPVSTGQVSLIVISGLIGILLYKPHKNSNSDTYAENPADKTVHRPVFNKKNMGSSALWLLMFTAPFLLAPWLHNPESRGLYHLYEAASLVFGGGHVVLPFLYQDFVQSGLIRAQQFDLGYAFAQLMPGPLFSFSAYLGASVPLGSTPLTGALLAVIAIFLPSFFLLFATLPHWQWLMAQHRIQAALMGINAAVCGLLLAMIGEMSRQQIHQISDLFFVLLVMIALRSKAPVWLILPGSFFIYLWLINFLQT